MVKRIPKLVYTWFPLTWLLTMLLIFWLMNGKFTLGYEGFGIDASGNIYLGKIGTIEVLDPNGIHVSDFDPLTDRGYDFCVVEGTTAFVDTGEYFYIMNLDGSVIQKIDKDEDSELPKITPRQCVLPDGTRYVMRSPWLRMTIYRENSVGMTEIYRSPLENYLLVLLYIFNFINLGATIALILWRTEKLNPGSIPLFRSQNTGSEDERREATAYIAPESGYSNFCQVKKLNCAAGESMEDDEGSARFKRKPLPKWFIPLVVVFLVVSYYLMRLCG